MQNVSLTSSQSAGGGHIAGLNGSHNQPQFPVTPGGNKFILEQVDPTKLEDDDSDSDIGDVQQMHLLQQELPNVGLSGPKPGKKTKGRVKIKMEFIENKLRRYTTFSKRKTGIMKKAYELSTLTGTQVMLLVASETGHVYTFATRKLQPMITSESGKALIQTCLNSPDPPPIAPGQQQAMEQRMNPSGFEETELTCAVSEEESKNMMACGDGMSKPVYQMPNIHVPEQYQTVPATSTTTMTIPAQISSSSTQSPPSHTIHQLSPSPTSSPMLSQTKQVGSNLSMELPPGLIFQPSSTATSQQQLIYKIPTPTQILSTSSSGSGMLTTPGIVMYQTPQGVVYATPTASLQDRTIFNFQQPATAISVPQADQQAGTQILIPVPVSLAGNGNAQVLQFASHETGILEVAQPPVKKSRK
ncbi:serum response factor-like isoform X2 [Gigantopelta aegis]|uniref:serum response factor-like isoform X2 n=1 Tax=Gigantopelta aegis TaxID=1735272 RepID=UPI001B88BB44|nr:serum response factor-like isoform X2 [Gigantopelta aegis]